MKTSARLFRGLLAQAALVAGLFGAGGAQAQLDGSLYGVADVSYGRFEPSGQLREERANSNSLQASFVGVNGRYGLDGGWTPGITLETFLRFQDGRTGRRDDDPGLSRNAFVSLASLYGLLRVGRLQTLMFDATARFNALGNSPAFSPALRHVFLAGNLEGVQGDFYWDRALGYTTPNLEGVTGSLILAQPDKGLDGHLAAGTLIVARGLLGLGLSVQQVRLADGFSDPTREDTLQLGVNYNFGLFKVFGLVTSMRDQGLDVKSRSVSAGFNWALGPGNVVFQAAQTRATGPAVDRRHTSISGGYILPYDSTLDLYVLAMDDRVNFQTRGVSAAAGFRLRY